MEYSREDSQDLTGFVDDIEEDDIEEDDFEEDTNFCSRKIPFNINRVNNFVTQSDEISYSISHSISIAENSH